MPDPIEKINDDDLFTCWCGVQGAFEEMFSDDIEYRCGGSGYVHCECGGDGLCVCHYHGGTECDGCDDCRPDDDLYEDDPEFWDGSYSTH